MKPMFRIARRCAFWFSLTAVFLTPVHARTYRDLTNVDGKVLRHVELVDLTDDNILKVRIDLKDYQLPLDKLSKEDRKWLEKWNADKKGIKLVPKLDPDAGYTREIFADDFSGSAFGPKWGHYKSGSVLKDGVLVGITLNPADHNGVDSIRIDPEKDLEVAVKFRFTSEKAKGFNVWFDDKDYKGSHAGHICSVSLSHGPSDTAPGSITISDAKTGGMDNKFYDKKKNAPESLTEEEKKFLASKVTSIPTKLTMQDWHKLVIRTSGDKAEVAIDDVMVGSFQSEGIAHETKSVISLTTNTDDVHYDDFSIKGIGTVLAKP